MLAAGVKPEEISKFLRQDVDSLIPYEVNNEIAIETLKKVEKKGLLMGKSFQKNSAIQEGNPIIDLLKDVNVIERNKQNMILKINNPKEVLPLSPGSCVDYNNFEICGDLICLACDEFRSDSLDDFYSYATKVCKYIYKYKRDKQIIKFEKKLLVALEKAYGNLLLDKKESFDIVIKKVRKIAREELKNDGQNCTDVNAKKENG